MKKEKIVSPKNFIKVISETFTLIILLLFLFYFIKIMLWVQLHKSQNKKLNPNFDKFKNVWTHKIMEHHKWWDIQKCVFLVLLSYANVIIEMKLKI